MRQYLTIISLLISLISSAQNWQLDWNTSMRMAGTTGEYMPFWSRTGEDGILPVTSSGLVTAGADISYEPGNHFKFEAGTNLAGALARTSPVNRTPVYGFVDRLYLSGSWKMLHLDIGMKPRERTLSDVSVSGGNIIYSRNARNMPGINAWSDWIYFEKGHWFGIRGNLAHYQTIDNRYVSGAMIHNKSLAVKLALGPHVDFSVGLEHWAQWGGMSPLYGKQPVSASDMWRIFIAGKGGEDASWSDQVNVLGNHLGKECFRLDWRHSDFTMTLQYDKPFEDGSGMKYKNAPDGIWSVQFLLKDRKAFLTDIVFEYIQTSWQSGPAHERPATKEEMDEQAPDSPFLGVVVLGGCDNYFGNGEYRSGWTHHNRTIGVPLILPAAPDADGITRDMVSTRLKGLHLGLKGMVASKVPYAMKITYTGNYGVYNQPASSYFESKPWQLSLALEAGLGRDILNMPLDLSVGLYGDIGKLYRNSVGLTLKITYSDCFRF